MRLLIAEDALAAYPNHNKRFNIYTDASGFQLGAWIIQYGQPVAYFNRKLNKAQTNYNNMEKYMISIIATLEDYLFMLLGANIYIFTDNKNLNFYSLKTQQILRWRKKVEEYLSMLHYIEGLKNILAD